ncbi:MAG: transport system, NAD-binding component [Actinomycetia bacterium]|nr:transport system, NAD-binding component [Actinomycetes bacterium]
MNVVVVGCGRVGSELATSLERSGHKVSIIDKKPTAFSRLDPGFAGEKITGFGFDREHLTQAGIERADAFAAVTSGDNSNILAARVAREHFGVKRVVARIYDPRRAAIYQRLGIPTVATVSWTTEQVLRRLLPEEATADWVDPSGKVCVVERELPNPWAGKKISMLQSPGKFNVVLLTRLGLAQIPTAELLTQQGDILRFVASVDALDELDHHLAHPEEHH